MLPASCMALALMLQTVEAGEATFRPTAAEASVPELFRMAEATFRYEIEPVRETRDYSVSRVRFPSAIESPEAANNTVPCEYFRPKGAGKHPAVVVLHILGGDFALSRYYAARLADRGVAALFLKLPYYGERRPSDGAQKFASSDVGRSQLSMRQGICDIRRGVAWLASRPEVDPTKLGATGISLGGITSALAVAVSPELGRGAFLLAGGGLDEILWEMDEPEARRYRQAWLAAGRTRDELKALTEPYDPLTYADRLKGKKLLMMAGNVDEVVPPSSARKLWEASGKPPIRWFDCGHYSSAGYLLPALREAVDFLAEDAPR